MKARRNALIKEVFSKQNSCVRISVLKLSDKGVEDIVCLHVLNEHTEVIHLRIEAGSGLRKGGLRDAMEIQVRNGTRSIGNVDDYDSFVVANLAGCSRACRPLV